MEQHDREGGSGLAEPKELVDVEQYGKRGEKPPRALRYRIRIDKQYYETEKSRLTGTEILALASKTPASHYLDQKLHGGTIKRIQPAEEVDLTEKGVERFMTLPKNETEGTFSLTRARGMQQ